MTSYDILSDVKHPTHKMFIIHEFVWEVSPHNPMGLILSLNPNEDLQTELTLRQTQYLGELPRKWGRGHVTMLGVVRSKDTLNPRSHRKLDWRVWEFGCVSGIAFGFAIVLSPCAQVTWDYPQQSTPIFTRSPGFLVWIWGLHLLFGIFGVTYSYIDQCQ